MWTTVGHTNKGWSRSRTLRCVDVKVCSVVCILAALTATADSVTVLFDSSLGITAHGLAAVIVAKRAGSVPLV